MNEITAKDITGRVLLFAALTASMYFLHLLSWKYNKKKGWTDEW